MQKLTMALLISMTAANMAYADCASDLKKFNDAKTFVLENAKTVSEVANELNTAITAEITIDNTKLFAGTVTKLDNVANQIKKNRDTLSATRASYQAAKCSAAATPAEAAPATATPAQ